MKSKGLFSLTAQEAVENFSSIVRMESEKEKFLGLSPKHTLVIAEKAPSYKNFLWFSPENAEEFLEVLKESYNALLLSLKEKTEKDQIDWKDKKSRRGVQDLMVLASDATSKIEVILAFFPNAKEITKPSETKEFKELRAFYHDEIETKFEEMALGDEGWQSEWENSEHALLLDVEKSSLKDFEAVKLDQEYELFYLHDEEGKSFFSPDLLRSIKLACRFDESLGTSFEEDPLLRISFIKDRDLQASSRQILLSSCSSIDIFYKKKLLENRDFLSESLSSSILALMLASNPNHLLQNTKGKNCESYFKDFFFFLQSALKSEEYRKILSYPSELREENSKDLLLLCHQLCGGFFMRVVGIKEEMIGFLHLLIHKGEEKRKKKIISKGIWEKFLEIEETIRFFLSFSPNGPLFKILDIIREEEKGLFSGFEPISQGNFPSKLYEVETQDKTISLLRIPSPTRQETLSQVEVAEEFKGFLRLPSRHLLVNFQDRTSWKEYSRSHVLEELSKQIEFKENLFVVTLSKEGDFYFQREVYAELNQAKDFIEHFEEQIRSEEECGFFFPVLLKGKDFFPWITRAMILIHNLFFHGKNVLSKKERLDFIELFYFFFFVKIIEILKPTTMSFTCKDAIDVGQAESAAFYAMIGILQQKKWDKEEEDTLLWLFQGPAFLIRERPINSQRLFRMISLLFLFDEEMKMKGKKIFPKLSSLYSKDFLSSLSIKGSHL